MPTFMCSLNWTDQGIRSIKDAPKRAKAAQDLAKKVGVEIKQVYLTSGDSDLLVILDTPQRRQRRQLRACAGLARKRATRTRWTRSSPRTTFGRARSSLERVIVHDLLAAATPENQEERL